MTLHVPVERPRSPKVWTINSLKSTMTPFLSGFLAELDDGGFVPLDTFTQP